MKKANLPLILILLILQFFLLPFSKTVKSDYECPTKLNVSKKFLEFSRWSKDSNPKMNFVLSNLCDGILKGELTTSVKWIKLSDTSFETNLKEIIVHLDVSNLSPGLYKEEIKIKTNGGSQTLPIRLDLVENKVIVQLIYDWPRVLVNSKQILLDTAPFVNSGLSYMPLRFICESLGATVSFERIGIDKTKIINILYKDTQAQLTEGNNYMLLNSIKYKIDGPFLIRNNSTFIPLNVIKTIFNPNIEYNSDQRLFTITY